MNESLNYIVLEKYLLQAVRAISGSVVSKYRMNFRCNICGENPTKRHTKRGFLLFNHKGREKYWVYKCQRPTCRANEGWSAEWWLKNTDPFLHNCYKNELKQCDRDDDHASAIRAKIEKLRLQKDKEIEIENAKKLVAEKRDIRFFKPILKGKDQIFIDSRAYCERRKIPNDVWKNFYVATGGKYRNRLIIPFLDKDGQVYYWQGRHLYGEEPKYLNRTVDKSEAIYNFYGIDKAKPVIVLEGPIDSMFVENGIATLGLELGDKMQRQIDEMNAYYLFDNDEAGNTKARKFLKEGKFVFLWKDFIKDKSLTKDIKDINDVILRLNIDKFSFEDLKKYFTNSYIDVLYF
jgi:hypothetical protein